MKKVLYIVTKSNWGGAQRYVYDLATHLLGEWEPIVAFGPAQGSHNAGILEEKLRERGVRTVFMSSLARDIGGGDWHALHELIHLMRTERPHVVHLNSSKVGGLGALAARIAGMLALRSFDKAGPRIIFTAHGWAFREARNPLSRGLIWLTSLATIILAHRTICVSEADMRAFSWIPFIGRKLIRIYNGIDLAMECGSGASIRAAFPPGAHITGTIGELTTNKNQTALIEQALANPHMYLAIVGEGEDRALLESLIAHHQLGDRVKLFGFMPSVEVLRGFDTFALPSHKEGLPYVVIEARAAGLPVVANRTGGVGEILDLPLETFSLERVTRETYAQYA